MNSMQTPWRPIQLLDRRFPDRLPLLTGKWLKLFRLLWSLVFAFAIIAPLAGIYVRLSEPAANSWLFPGSRVGLALDPEDATKIRFPVGATTRSAGVQAGDRLLALDGAELIAPLTISDEAVSAWAKHPAYSRLPDLLFGSAEQPVRLSIKSQSGEIRELTVVSGESHIDEEARRLRVSPTLLSLIDLAYALFYPVLLWIALALHLRNPKQPVAALLSISILIFLVVEQPSGAVVAQLVPRAVHVMFYDLANMALIAAILLYPDGALRPRAILLPLLLLPLLLLLQGTAYQIAFVIGLSVAMLGFVERLKGSLGAKRQQLKLLFVGLGLYPLIRLISLGFDALKSEASSVEQSLLFDLAAGTTFALSSVAMFAVLFSALRHHRLYDAEALFSRSAMYGALTVTVASFFAISSTILEAASESVLGGEAGAWPSIIAAAAAVLLIKPTQRRIHDWAERQFQKGLFELRTQLPKRMEDLRETSSPTALLQDALRSIVTALRSTAGAAIVDNRVVARMCTTSERVRRWRASVAMEDIGQMQLDRADEVFPLRMQLLSGMDRSVKVGWILLGPRPDGSLYSKEERDVLLEIEESIARAVEVARERERGINADRRWKARQEKRLQAIEDQLANVVLARQRKTATS